MDTNLRKLVAHKCFTVDFSQLLTNVLPPGEMVMWVLTISFPKKWIRLPHLRH